MVSKAEVLKRLPKFTNTAVLIEESQGVPDIIREVLDAHEHFAQDYDTIADLFYTGELEDCAILIFDFLKANVKYKIEGEEWQTTKSPAALLVNGFGDCKHYAGFIGGVLAAINRKYGKGFKWKYRFASYKLLDDMPQHVFVVAKDSIGELWIDPVLRELDERLAPYYFVDKKINDSMALHRLSGLGAFPITGSVSVVAHSIIPQFGQYLQPFLGLSAYKTGGLGVNWSALANEINAQIAQGPDPGHQVNGEFVQWIFLNNAQFWNFYYAGGVVPGFQAETILSPYYPRPVISPDGRLTFSKMQPLDDLEPGFQILCAWIQALINEFDETPYPIKPEAVKGFTQGKFGDLGAMNMFSEIRGSSFLKDIGKALEDAVNFVKDGVLKIVGSIPRNAMLGLIGINAFAWADNLWEKIEQGRWEAMARTWKGIGGNPQKFYNTIETGKDKAAILGYTDDGKLMYDTRGNIIGVEPTTTATASAAWLAAAAPVIAVLLKFLDKDGKAGEIAGAVKTSLENIFPGVKIAIGDSLDFLDANTGKPIEWVVDPADDENLGGGNDDMPGDSFSGFAKRNPVILAGGAAIGTYFLVNKKGRKPNYLIPAIAGAAVFAMLQMTGNKTGLTTEEKRRALLEWNATVEGGEALEPLIAQSFTAAEIASVYEFIFDYLQHGKQLTPGSALYNSIQQIATKYEIFT